jgi:hypothetical protein
MSQTCWLHKGRVRERDTYIEGNKRKDETKPTFLIYNVINMSETFTCVCVLIDTSHNIKKDTCKKGSSVVL